MAEENNKVIKYSIRNNDGRTVEVDGHDFEGHWQEYASENPNAGIDMIKFEDDGNGGKKKVFKTVPIGEFMNARKDGAKVYSHTYIQKTGPKKPSGWGSGVEFADPKGKGKPAANATGTVAGGGSSGKASGAVGGKQTAAQMAQALPDTIARPSETPTTYEAKSFETPQTYTPTKQESVLAPENTALGQAQRQMSKNATDLSAFETLKPGSFGTTPTSPNAVTTDSNGKPKYNRIEDQNPYNRMVNQANSGRSNLRKDAKPKEVVARNENGRIGVQDRYWVNQQAEKNAKKTLEPAVDKIVSGIEGAIKEDQKNWLQFDAAMGTDTGNRFGANSNVVAQNALVSQKLLSMSTPSAIWDRLNTKDAGGETPIDKIFGALDVNSIMESSRRAAMDPQDYIERFVAPQLAQTITDRIDEKYLPENFGEYIVAKLGESIVGRIATLATMPKEARQKYEEGVNKAQMGESSKYNAGLGARLASSITNVTADVPAFGFFGKVGELTTVGVRAGLERISPKAAEWFMPRVMALAAENGGSKASQMAASRYGSFITANVAKLPQYFQNVVRQMPGGIANMGSFMATSSMLSEAATGEDTTLGTLWAAGWEGFKHGAEFGTVMPVVGNAVRMPFAGKTTSGIKNFGVGVISKTSELASMIGLDWYHEGDNFNFINSLEANASMMLGMHLKQVVGGVAGAGAKLYKDGLKKSWRDLTAKVSTAHFKLTDDERAEIQRLYPDVDITAWADIENFATPNGDSFVERILADKANVSWETRNKISAALFGAVNGSRPLMDGFTIDGSTAKIYSADGELIATRKFDNVDDCQAIYEGEKVRKEHQITRNALGAFVLTARTQPSELDYIRARSAMYKDLYFEDKVYGVDAEDGLAKYEADCEEGGVLRDALEKYVRSEKYHPEEGLIWDFILDTYGEDTDIYADDIISALYKDPLTLKEREREMLSEFYNYVRPLVDAHNDGKYAPQASTERGHDVANDADLTGEAPNGEAVERLKAHIADSNGKAMSALEAASRMLDAEGLEDQVSDFGKISEEEVMRLVEGGLHPDKAKVLLDYISARNNAENAQIMWDAFIEKVGKDIDSEMEMEFVRYAHKGTMDGEKSEMRFAVPVVTKDGRTLFVSDGDVTTEANASGTVAGNPAGTVAEYRISSESGMLVAHDSLSGEVVFLTPDEIAQVLPMMDKEAVIGQRRTEMQERLTREFGLILDDSFASGKTEGTETALTDGEPSGTGAGASGDTADTDATLTSGDATDAEAPSIDSTIDGGEVEGNGIEEQPVPDSVPSSEVDDFKNKRATYQGNRKEGRASHIYVGGKRYSGHYVLGEAGDTMTSHDPFNNYEQTKGVPKRPDGTSNNDRDYKHDSNAQQLNASHAATYHLPEELPVTSKDGVVYSGNDREMARALSAENGTDSNYASDLAERAEEFGFTAEDLAGYKHPTVRFELDEVLPYDTATYAMFNGRKEKAMNSTEASVKNAKILRDKPALANQLISAIKNFDSLTEFYKNADSQKECIDALIREGVWSENERPLYQQTNGALTRRGRIEFEDVVRGLVFSEEAIRILDGDDMVAINNAIMKAIPALADNNKLGDYSIMRVMEGAVKMVNEAINGGFYKGGSIFDYYDQVFTMGFERELERMNDDGTPVYDDSERALGVVFAHVLAKSKNTNSVKFLFDFLETYNKQAKIELELQTQKDSGMPTLLDPKDPNEVADTFLNTKLEEKDEDKRNFTDREVEQLRKAIAKITLGDSTDGTGRSEPKGEGTRGVGASTSETASTEGEPSGTVAGTAGDASGTGVGGNEPKDEHEAYKASHPLTKDEIAKYALEVARETGRSVEDIIDDAMDYLNGDHSKFAQAAYSDVYDAKTRFGKAEADATGMGDGGENGSHAPEVPGSGRGASGTGAGGGRKPHVASEAEKAAEAELNGALDELSALLGGKDTPKLGKVDGADLTEGEAEGAVAGRLMSVADRIVDDAQARSAFNKVTDIAAKLGFEKIKGGLFDKDAWKEQFTESMGERCKTVLEMDDAEWDSYLEDLWNSKRVRDNGERKTLSEWADEYKNRDTEGNTSGTVAGETKPIEPTNTDNNGEIEGNNNGDTAISGDSSARGNGDSRGDNTDTMGGQHEGTEGRPSGSISGEHSTEPSNTGGYGGKTPDDVGPSEATGNAGGTSGEHGGDNRGDSRGASSDDGVSGGLPGGRDNGSDSVQGTADGMDSTNGGNDVSGADSERGTHAQPIVDTPSADAEGTGTTKPSADAEGTMTETEGNTSGAVVADEAEQKVNDKVELTKEKVNYAPKSKGKSLGSVVPAGLNDAMQKNLEEIGDVDEYTREALGYDSVEDMHKGLAAEQVDGVALSIKAMRQGYAPIIADQTGLGKGRQAASILRYGMKNGMTPIFFTEKAHLFTDIYRDMVNTGNGDKVPFIIASDAKKGTIIFGDKVIPLPSKEEVAEFIKTGKLPKGYDYAVCTYSQIFEHSGEREGVNDSIEATNERDLELEGRRKAVAQLAKNNIVVFDESHNAAGADSSSGRYCKQLVKDARGVTFFSATYAKRAENMGLYAMRSVIGDANMSEDALINAIKRGGPVFQEVLARELAESGALIRRERDMKGVTVDWEKSAIGEEDQRGQYDSAIGMFRDISALQKRMAAMVNDYAKKQYGSKVRVSFTSNRSRLFNVTSQLFTALKVEDTIRRAVEILQGEHDVDVDGEIKKVGGKVFIPVVNTNDNILKDFAVDEAMAKNDFTRILERCLEKSMIFRISTKDMDMEISALDLFGEDGIPGYRELKADLDVMETGMSLSPIDALKEGISAAGFKVGEITGRKLQVVKNENGEYVLSKRKAPDPKEVVNQYNDGDLDVVIVNVSANSGISLHASKEFKDQRKRFCITLQAQLDVNQETQIRGRVDRTGQLYHAAYSYLVSHIPAENRPMMMLKAKLKSLDAQTTASQKSEFNEVDAPDFANKYGSSVIVDILKEDDRWVDALDDPFGWDSNPVKSREDVKDKYVAKDKDYDEVMKRVALLNCAEQEEFFELVVDRYQSLIDKLNATGMNDLEIKNLPLDATVKNTGEVIKGEVPGGKNTFADSTYVEEVEANNTDRPFTRQELEASISKTLDGKSDEEMRNESIKNVDEWTDKEIEKAKTAAETRMQNRMRKFEQTLADKRKKEAEKGNVWTDEEFQQKIDEQRDIQEDTKNRAIHEAEIKIASKTGTLRQGLKDIKIGKYVQGMRKDGVNVVGFKGVVVGYEISKGMNPATSFITIASARGEKLIKIPFADTMAVRSMAADVPGKENAVSEWDSMVSSGDARETRYVYTGNLLNALAQGRKGQIVNYTLDDGAVVQGMLLPKGTTINDIGRRRPLIEAYDQVMNFWKKGQKIQTSDRRFTIKFVPWSWNNREHFELSFAKNGKTTKIQQDRGLAEASGAVFGKDDTNFFPDSTKTNCILQISPDRLKDVMKYLTKNYNAEFDDAIDFNAQAAEANIQGIARGNKYSAKSFKDVFDKLTSDKGDKKFDDDIKNLANDVFKVAEALGIKFSLGNTTSNKGVLGYYDAKNNEIRYKFNHIVYGDAHEAAETVLHEAIHGVTAYAFYARKAGKKMSKELSDAVDTIIAIQRTLKDDPRINLEYGIREDYRGTGFGHEAAAEMSNRTYREKLKSINLWDKFVNAVSTIIKSLWKDLKLPAKDETAFDRMDEALKQMLDNFDLDLYREMTGDNYLEEEGVLGKVDDGEKSGKLRYMSFAKDTEEFSRNRSRAVREKGMVLDDIAEKEVPILSIGRHNFGTGTLGEVLKIAGKWAKDNFVGKTFSLANNGGDYVISNKAIKKYLSESAFRKSENQGVHLAVLEHLPEVIENSLDAEIHPDYAKNENGDRAIENGIDDKNLLIHRMYGAVTIDGRVYRVKTTMQEFGGNKKNTPHSYEVTKIELLDAPEKTSRNSSPVAMTPNNSITGAKLLENVEKSYDSGKKLLDESKNTKKTAQEAIDKFGGKGTVVSSEGELDALGKKALAENPNAMGWYNTETGEVTVYLPNCPTAYEVERTVLHEKVGHEGLRQVMDEMVKTSGKPSGTGAGTDGKTIGRGGGYDEFLRQVWRGLSPEQRKGITDRMQRNGWKMNEAIDEELAARAEDFSDSGHSFIEKVKNVLRDFMSALGFKTSMTDDDVRTALWLSAHHLENKKGDWEYVARRKAFEWKLKRGAKKEAVSGDGYFFEESKPKADASGTEATSADVSGTVAKTAGETAGTGAGLTSGGRLGHDGENVLPLRFRNMSDEDRDKIVMTPSGSCAADAYDRKLRTIGYLFTEGYQNNLNAMRIAQEAICGGKEKVKDSENVVWALNQLSSKDQQELERFHRDYASPLTDAIKTIVPVFDGKTAHDRYEKVQHYVYAKHGLERNRVVAVRDYVRELQNSDDAADKARGQQFQADFDNLRMQLKTDLDNGVITLRDYYDQLDSFIRTEMPKFDAGKMDKAGLSDDVFEWNSSAHASGTVTEKGHYDDDAVIDHVMDAEARMGKDKVDALWDSIGKASQFTIQKDYDCGIINRKAKTRMETMFSWYVPLRGFHEDTAEDVWGYINGETSYVGKSAMKAEGRISRADEPLATLMAMGNAAIMRGNRNVAKQTLVRLVRNNQNNLIREMKLAYVEGVDAYGSPTLEAIYPQFAEDATPQDIEQAISDYETDIATRQANGEKIVFLTDRPNPEYRIVRNADANQHLVTAHVNGKEVTMIVQAHPRAAQAVNGMLINSTKGLSWVKEFNSQMSQLATSRNLTFMMRNAARDWDFASSSLIAKEGVRYNARFHWMMTKLNAKAVGNLGSSLFTSKNHQGMMNSMANLFSKYKTGTLDDTRGANGKYNNEVEGYFKEYLDNGGATGWVQLGKVDDYKKMIHSELDKHFSKHGKAYNMFMLPYTGVKKVLTGYMGIVETANEAVENQVRFSTYYASRKAMRSIKRSIDDAKGISVNFNKTGAGSATLSMRVADESALHKFVRVGVGSTSWYMKNFMWFFNARVQGMARTVQVWNESSKSGKAIMLTKFIGLPMVLSGLALPMWNAMIAENDDEEDKRKYGDNPYAQLPEFIRRKNTCLYLGHGRFAMFPLSPEISASYALGDIFAGMSSYPELQGTKPIPEQIAEAMMQAIPVDILGGSKVGSNDFMGGIAGAVTPSAVQPLIAVATNVGWTGSKISRAEYYEHDPKWTHASERTSGIYVKIAKKLNELSGGNDVESGAIDIDASKLEYLVEQFFSGPGKDLTQTSGLMTSIYTGEDIDKNSIPVARALYRESTRPADRINNSRARWYKFLKDSKETKRHLKQYKDQGRELEWETKSNSREGKIAAIVDAHDKNISKLSKQRNLVTSKADRDMIQEQINTEMMNAIREIDEIK